ncbi:MAG: hypothetical protein HOY79_46800 [Streptomyces sp.]|nr:hypothetical protein [Streptomyces sp.]
MSAQLVQAKWHAEPDDVDFVAYVLEKFGGGPPVLEPLDVEVVWRHDDAKANDEFRALLSALRHRDRREKALASIEELLSVALAANSRYDAVLSEHLAFAPQSKWLSNIEAAIRRSTSTEDRFGPSRHARRDIFRYLRAALEAVSREPRGESPPFSRVLAQFRTSLVGTLTRNAPPLTAQG